MFRGISQVNMDDKGRLAVPSRYRHRLLESAKNHIVVTIDTESPCLLLYPLPAWEKIEVEIAALPSLSVTARRLQRLLIGHATELELDKNGRILLPALLRDYAKLKKQTMLVGQSNKFEIWSDEQWKHHRALWLASNVDHDDQQSDALRKLVL